MNRWRVISAWFLTLALAMLAAPAGRSANKLPAKPADFFNDYAGVVDAGTAQSLNHTLADFERETSDQLLVAIYPRLPSGEAAEDFTVKTAEAWGVGQKGKSNGAILFVFVAEHSLRIEVGYGLEPVLTDAISSEIIHQIIVPKFRAGDYSGGIEAGVQAMMQACRGEFHGTGRTHAENARGAQPAQGINFFTIGFFVLILLVSGFFKRRNANAMARNPLNRWRGNNWPNSGGGWFVGGGGGGFGGGSSSGGNDSFSGGGGSFGGGGAGGNW